MELGREDFELLRDLVYERTGLMFDDKKVAFMHSRLARRLPAARCKGARDYYRHLRYQDPDGAEFQAFLDLLTTNETYFFRDYPQLECFANEVLPRIAQRKRAAGDAALNVWSAACSTGDEPYTLAIILRACLDDFARWRVRVLATDIDTCVLATARAGAYSQRAVKDVPQVYFGQYFRAVGRQFHVADEVKRLVSFSRLNLVDRQAMRAQRGYDVIFCRNVLIYFDDRSRARVLEDLYDALLPGGFIFLGHSESVGRISAAFESLSLGGVIVYRKPTGAGPA
jgi:chemotaxis protein methyltransferase CheR